MELRNRLTRNTGFVFASGTVSKLFAFIFVAYAARVLGPEEFGLYALIGTFTFFFSFFGDFGINAVAIREISKNREKIEEVFNSVLSLKVGLVVLAYPFLFAAVNILGYGENIKYLIYIAGLTAIFSVFSSSFGIIYMALERFKVPALISAFVSLLHNFANIIVLYLGYGVKGIVWVSFFGALTGAVISGLWIRKKIFRYRFVYNLSAFKDIVAQSMPFAAIAFFQQANIYMNILLLSKLPGPVQGKIAIGYYNPPASLCRNAMMLPDSFRKAALPTVAANSGNVKVIESIIEKSTKSFLALIIFPLILATTFFPKEIISIIFGKAYLPSASALTILGWAYALQVFNVPVTVTLIASREIRLLIPWAALVFSVNLVFAVPLIIYYSYMGAAAAFLVSKIFETFIRHYLLQVVWGINSMEIQKSLYNILGLIAATLVIISIAKYFTATALVLLILTLSLYFFCMIFSKDFRQGISVLFHGMRG